MPRYPHSFRARRTYDLIRFSYECARCAAPDRPMGWYTDLERAHLDGDRANNTDENIVVLCRHCHRAYDYRVWRLYTTWLEAERERRIDAADATRPILALLRGAA